MDYRTRKGTSESLLRSACGSLLHAVSRIATVFAQTYEDCLKAITFIPSHDRKSSMNLLSKLRIIIKYLHHLFHRVLEE